jgi:hypothetical protein
MKVFGIQFTPAILRVHFQSAGLSTQHIHANLNPDDKPDVKLAFSLRCNSQKRRSDFGRRPEKSGDKKALHLGVPE